MNLLKVKQAILIDIQSFFVSNLKKQLLINQENIHIYF